jgi:hypothetical protein
LNLDLFGNKRNNSDLAKELINVLKNVMNEARNMKEVNNELDEYNLYEKRKIFLDNKSRKGNELAWIMDDNSVCISQEGEGGPISVNEINLPKDRKVGEVYEKIEGQYIYNSNITEEIKKII